MKKLAMIMAVAGLILAATGAAQADDVRPPDWRGDPNSTVQEWDFLTDTNPLAPDGPLYDNAFGEPPSAGLDGSGMAWIDGSWAGVENIICEIPNNPDPNKEKWIRVQVTYSPDEVIPYLSQFTAPDSVSASVGGDVFEGQLIETIDLGKTSGYPSYYQLYLDVWDIVIPYNPPVEVVLVHFPQTGTGFGDMGGYVDQLVIDTICVPEPATMSLLVLGGLALIRKRRKA